MGIAHADAEGDGTAVPGDGGAGEDNDGSDEGGDGPPPGAAAAGGGGGSCGGGGGARSRRLRAQFAARARALVAEASARALALVDEACDELGVRNVWDRLPPPPPPRGRVGSWRAPASVEWDAARAEAVAEAARVTLDSRVRLRARSCVRLAADRAAGVCVMHHAVANTRVFRALAAPEQEVFAPEAGPALEAVLGAYPKGLRVRDLPVGSMEEGEAASRTKAHAPPPHGEAAGDEGAGGDAEGDDQVRLDVARALVEAGVALHLRAGDSDGSGRGPDPSQVGRGAAGTQGAGGKDKGKGHAGGARGASAGAGAARADCCGRTNAAAGPAGGHVGFAGKKRKRGGAAAEPASAAPSGERRGVIA